MALGIPFANQLVPAKADRTFDGGIYSTVPFEQPDYVVSSALIPTNVRVLIGDEINGQIQWGDYTTASGNATVDDIPIFNGIGGMYCVAFEEGDVVESFDWYQTTLGTFTMNATVTAFYRNTSGVLVEQTGLAIPSLATTGIKRLMLTTPISYTSLGEMDDPVDPSLQRRRFVFFKFVSTGANTYTSPALASLFWKRRQAGSARVYTDVTTAVNAVDKTPYTNISALSKVGDRVLFGFDCKTPVLVSDITRIIGASSTGVKWVYSNGAGTVGYLTAAQVHTFSTATGTTVPFTKIGQYIDAFQPQDDWVKDTINGQNLYWIGVEHISDGTAPALIGLYTIYGMCPTESTATGITTRETATYTKFEMYCRTTSPGEAELFVGNKRTGQISVLKILSNTTHATKDISMPVIPGDEITVALLHGDSLFNVADGFIRIAQ